MGADNNEFLAASQLSLPGPLPKEGERLTRQRGFHQTPNGAWLPKGLLKGVTGLLPVVGIFAVFAQVMFIQQCRLHAVNARRQLT